MHKPDILRTTFDQQPHLAEAYHDTPLGTQVEFTVKATLKARDQEGMDWTVEAVVPDGYELDPDAVEPKMMGGLSQSDAMMTPSAMMVRRKNQLSKED